LLVISDTADLLLLAIASAYGRDPGPCLPSTFKREIRRSSADIAAALDELIREGVLELMADGSVVATERAWQQPVFAPCREAAVADPRVIAGFLLTARTMV
jgi:hypothetical protein